MSSQAPGNGNTVLNYPVGTLTNVIYDVSGSLEDWAYAAGWEKNTLALCSGISKEE